MLQDFCSIKRKAKNLDENVLRNLRHAPSNTILGLHLDMFWVVPFVKVWTRDLVEERRFILPSQAAATPVSRKRPCRSGQCASRQQILQESQNKATSAAKHMLLIFYLVNTCYWQCNLKFNSTVDLFAILSLAGRPLPCGPAGRPVPCSPAGRPNWLAGWLVGWLFCFVE